MVKLKFILKAFSCAVLFTSGALAKFDDKIYLLPQKHDSADHQSLAMRIAEKAKSHKAILGLELIENDSGLDYDFQCSILGICDLKKSDQRYFGKMENPLANVISHLIYFYGKLIHIQGWEQWASCSKDPAVVRAAKASIAGL